MKRWTFVVVAVMLFLLVACGSGGTVSVASAWGRVSPMNAENGAFYMQLVNEGDEDDALVSATAELCGTVELHESYMAEDGTMANAPLKVVKFLSRLVKLLNLRSVVSMLCV